MPFTDVQISNMALSAVGLSDTISALTEASVPAAQCKLHYADAVQLVFEDWHWPELTNYADLALVEEDPNADWSFSYRWPSDCLSARRLVTTMGRQDPTPPPFRTGQDDQGILIYANQEDAVLEYTANWNDPARFSAHLARAIAWKLAEIIAPSLTKMESREASCTKNYELALSKARARSANQGQSDAEPDAEHIQARV